MEASLQLPGLEDQDVVQPYTAPCPCCGEVVLVVQVDGHEVLVRAEEVVEEFDCPSCAQVANMGHQRHDCSRCSMSGKLGEPLPWRGIKVAADGLATEYAGWREEGEAVHPFHACTEV